MPVISFLTGGVDLTHYKLVIRNAVDEIPGIQKASAGISLNWGSFVQASIDFLIIAFCIFLVVKAMAKIKKPEPEPSKGPTQEQLLTEIRDLLKK